MTRRLEALRLASFFLVYGIDITSSLNPYE